MPLWLLKKRIALRYLLKDELWAVQMESSGWEIMKVPAWAQKWHCSPARTVPIAFMVLKVKTVFYSNICHRRVGFHTRKAYPLPVLLCLCLSSFHTHTHTLFFSTHIPETKKLRLINWQILQKPPRISGVSLG